MIAPASLCADYIARHYKLDPVSVEHIPYGVSEALIQQPRIRNSENDTVRLLYVGNYIALKGTSILEEILPPLGTRHPSMHLTFVIDDASVEAVKQRYTNASKELLPVTRKTRLASREATISPIRPVLPTPRYSRTGTSERTP